jgi:toluene monooxygenase system ferredoxin subunit
VAWQPLCSASDVAEGAIIECRLAEGGTVIALRTGSGEVRVFQGLCPHQERSLSDAYLDGDVLTCSAHMWSFDVAGGGEPLNGTPAGLAEYAVKIDGDDVLVETQWVQPEALWQ